MKQLQWYVRIHTAKHSLSNMSSMRSLYSMGVFMISFMLLFLFFLSHEVNATTESYGATTEASEATTNKSK